MATTDPYTVNNQDVVGVYNRIQTFMTEIFKCASSNVNLFSAADQARLQSYLTALLGYVGWVQSQPTLDLPKTSPRAYPLATFFVPSEDATNDEINDVLRMLAAARDELVSSGSARMPCGLIAADASRFLAVVDKAQTFLTTYIQKLTPLDMPESDGQPLTQVATGPGPQIGR